MCKRYRRFSVTTALAFLVCCGSAHAATLSEVGVGGTIEFSSDRLAPIAFLLDYTSCNNGGFGCNILTGRFGRSASGVVDLDYLRVVVPSGYTLSQTLLGNQTTVGGNTAFIGMASGPIMPVPSDATSAAGLLGWTHFGNADRGTDMLDNMAVSGAGASGFTTPLPAGDYSFWLQELASGGPYTYRLNFIIAPVPVPAAGWLLGSALLGLVALRGKRAGTTRR